jgi:raffinose/stachyose/melibiose transport system permease protein
MSKAVFIGFGNYIRIFTDANEGFFAAARNSLSYAVCAVFIQLPTALTFALALSNGVKGEKIFITAFFIPVLISTVVTGQLWMRIYDMQYGLLNRFLNALGLSSWTQPWLANPKTALGCVFIALLWQFIGYHMLLMYASIKTIPPEITESAHIDGAGFWQTSFRIVIPLIKPMIRVCLIFAVVGALKMFDLVFVMTAGGPARSTEVPSTLMYITIFRRFLFGRGSAMAMFIIMECFLFAYLIRKFIKVED